MGPSTSKPVVMILGATGQLGKIIADSLKNNNAHLLNSDKQKGRAIIQN